MTNENARLLTIYTEAALESHLITDLERHGAAGYTITNARGKGSRGVRTSSWDANSNIRIEVICDSRLARSFMAYLEETYYDNYAMVVYLSDIEVLRPNKFSG